ncbi:MAG: hypothetical protein NTX93_03790 [Bacteroidia bacterium]|nr:hypothetical protein [Bacteroidia bacterium]
MKIDRSNYEIWLIDWLDDNLSDLQVEQLKFFLSENPELKEEFDELTSLSLKPSDKTFQHKDHLKKSTSDLSVSQFEYLCVAYLENDLSAGQQTELNEIIDQDPEKKRTFELIQKMRLAPAGISYKHKSQLIKRTPAQRVIRLSAIVLSAAAVIAILIMTYFVIPRNLPDETNTTTQNIVIDSSLFKRAVDKVPDKIITDKKPVIPKLKRENLFAGVPKNNSVITQSDLTAFMPNDSLLRNPDDPEIQLKKIPVYAEIDLKERSVSNTLVASNSNLIIPTYDDERSNLSRFIAKTFRQKILKENISLDSPLKGYEIAEAGVTGLNKLLGWEMALDKNNDENGELRSVYFSSKILKFNAPVKKNEPLP